ncbi:unnamed protein product [Amoebophrya sp. A120]|nr:unnamed protein product [Amoebophrya sp. A120]|eukprot:GSA120T00014719001.1
MEAPGRSAAAAWDQFEEVMKPLMKELEDEWKKNKPEQRRKPWITDRTWKTIAKRRKLKTGGDRTRQADARLRRKIKHEIKEDKAAWLREKIEDLRKADSSGNARAVYETVRQLAGKARAKGQQHLPGGERPHVEFWASILGTKRPEADQRLKGATAWKVCEEMLQQPPRPTWETTHAGSPEDSEIDKAVKELKKGKSHASDFPAEFFAQSDTARRVLRLVVKKIFEGQQMPEKWLEAAIALLHKNGPRAEPANYRPAALLHVGEKLVGLIILNRIRESAYRAIDKRQKGSVRGLSCRHAVFRLLRDMEHAIKNGEERVYDFIDFQKAYDSLDWEKMAAVLRWQGFPADLVELVRRMYGSATYALKIAPGKLSGVTEQKSGIRQGSSLSPLIFVLVLDFATQAFELAMQREGLWARSKVDVSYLSWLGFVDDLVVRSDTPAEAQATLLQLQAACRFVGLELNAKKTEAMTIGLQPSKKDNRDAKKERFVTEEGTEYERGGWAVEWDGVDLVEEYAAAARSKKSIAPAMEKTTHLLVWDDGKFGLCWLKKTSWAVLDDGERLRLSRVGKVRFVDEERNIHKCPRCGDVLPDARALKWHRATGFCRPGMSTQEQKVLRVGRYLEEKAKAQRAAVVVPAGLRTYDGKEVATVGAFKYLGTQIANNGSTSKEVERRTGIAKATVGQLSKIWKDRDTPQGLKAELCNSLCSSVALYNSECWAMREHDWKLLRRFQLQTLKTATGERRRWQKEHDAEDETDAENEETEAEEYASRLALCRKMGVLDVETALTEKRIAWVGHAARDKTEASAAWIANEVKIKSEWGKMLLQDLEGYSIDFETLISAPPDAVTLKETLKQNRKVATERADRQRKVKTVTPKMEARNAEQRERIQQQRVEEEEKRQEMTSKISGKRWRRVPGARDGAWQLECDPEALFEACGDDFCENSGREVKYVAGVAFYRNQDQTWTAE